MSEETLDVEDHGNGYMIIGTNRIDLAREELSAYVEDPAPYLFAAVTHYEGRSAVWLSTGPAQFWDGAKDHIGQAIPLEGRG